MRKGREGFATPGAQPLSHQPRQSSPRPRPGLSNSRSSVRRFGRSRTKARNRRTAMKPHTRIGLAAAALAVAIAPLTAAQDAPRPDSSGYVTANGVNYWFEIHGKGEPLLLLHGGLGSTSMYGPVLSRFAETRRVIGVDLHGHGHTALGTRPINLIDIGNDLAVIVRALGLNQVDVVGYSFGGGAALRLAVQHPALVRRVVIASAPYAQNGFFPEMLPQQAAVGAAMAEGMKETPMYKSYAAIAPRPQ